MGAINTGSTLTAASGKNKTSTSSSTNIIVKVNDTAIGAIQKISFDEDRSIEMINELGTDGSIDSMPKSSTVIKGSCERIRFDRLRATAAFSRGFIHIASQVYPFDIVMYDTQNGGLESNEVIVTVLKNCWITSLKTAYNADNWVISDNLSFTCEHVYSFVGDSSVVAAGNELGILPEQLTGTDQANSIETEADMNKNSRRGSFDISGILRIVGV